MGRGKKFVAILLSILGLGSAFVAGAVVDEYCDLGIGESVRGAFTRLFNSFDEKTGELTDAACEIAKIKGEDFYTATEARYKGLMNRQMRVTYTPLFFKTNDDNSLSFTYKSSVTIGDKTLEDLMTAKLKISSNSETSGLLSDLESALRDGDEKKAGKIIVEDLSKSANFEISYAKEAENNNAALSNYAASKLTVDNLPSTLDDATKKAIIDKINANEFIVTKFKLVADGSSNGQINDGVVSVVDDNGNSKDYYNSLTAKNVQAVATIRVYANNTIYLIEINKGSLNFNLGRQEWNPNGVSAATLEKLINDKYSNLSADELATAMTDLSDGGAAPSVSVSNLDLGTEIKATKTISVGIEYGATFAEIKDKKDEDKKDEDEQVKKDAAAAAAALKAAQAQIEAQQQGQIIFSFDEPTNKTTTPHRH